MLIYRESIFGLGEDRVGFTEEVKFVTFPSGERMPVLEEFDVYYADLKVTYTIKYSIKNANDLIDLALVVDALKRRGTRKQPTIHLYAPYIMGSRQDRVCSEGQPLSAYVVANIINGMGFESVTTDTPHSDVMPSLIKNCIVKDRFADLFLGVFDYETYQGKRIFIVAPDAGASKRSWEALQNVNAILDSYTEHYESDTRIITEFVQGEKHRDPATGKIISFGCSECNIDKDDFVIVVDDVCGMGGTFLGLADILMECGATKENLCLMVTHADCVEGLKNVSEKYGMVVTTLDTATSLNIDTEVDDNIYFC